MRALTFLLLCACKPIAIPGLDSAPPLVSADDSAVVDSTPPDTDSPPEDEDIPAIFDDTVMHSIDISLSDAAAASLDADPYGWVPADVVIDGEAVPEIGLRLRGKIGSFRTLDGKPKFKLDFKEFVEDQRFQGLKHLSLNNSVVDCSYIKETTGYAVIRALGYPAPLASYAEVRVNGEPYGLYVVVEVQDDEFLERNFDAPDGNLYDGKYLWYGDWDYEFADFTPSLEDNFELEEGEDVGLADIHRVTEAAGADGTFNERFESLFDLTELHRFMLLEQWIGHIDGYVLNTNNYRVFFRPTDGRAVLLHWDLDYAYLSAQSWGFSWSSPSGKIARECWSDSECRADQAATLSTMTLDIDGVQAQAEAWVALTEDAAVADPRRECGGYDIEPEQDNVLGWLRVSQDRMINAWSD